MIRSHAYIFSLCRSSPTVAQAASFFIFTDHTKFTQTPDRTPLNERSARRKSRYLHKTQQIHKTNIHALSGIRTRDPRNRASEDICLRSRRDRAYKKNCFGRKAGYSTLVSKVFEKPAAFIQRY